MDDAPLEPSLADLVEAALEPYRGRLSEEDLAWMRAQLTESLLVEPALAPLADEVRGGPHVDESGKIVRRDILAGLAADAAADGEVTAADTPLADVVAIGGRRRG